MFTAKEQEFTDKNTGVTVTLGRHEDDASRSWLRIAHVGDLTRTTTAFFDGQGELLKLIPHGVEVQEPAQLDEPEFDELDQGPDPDER
jgi:hypothetical protein